MQMTGPAYMDYVLNNRVGGPKSNEHPVAAAAPHGVFPCVGEDRWISLAVPSDEEWLCLKAAMDNPAWSEEVEYSSLEKRLENIDELHAQVAQWTVGFDDYELSEKLQAQGVAAAPVLNVADLLSNPHYKARGTFIEVTHPLGFEETIYGAYVKTSRSKAQVKPGPWIGQDNERAFKGILGMDDDSYRQLIEDKVIY